MKDHLAQTIARAPNDTVRRWVASEYLQARVLQAIQEKGVFTRWAFHGGTALRFLYAIPRFSEDLDFSIVTPDADPGFRAVVNGVKHALEAEAYRVAVTVKEATAVASAMVRFPGLLHELGLSARPTEVLAIKMELDTRPPSGATFETTIVRRHVVLNLHHHDRPSLLAGKLHAILSRPWTKGRDLYDLVWYLADPTWPAPNLAFLNAALVQTAWQGETLTQTSWRRVLLDRLSELDWPSARRDVVPFLERPPDADLVSFETCRDLLER